MNSIDIVLDILKSMITARPDNNFVKSLYAQYCERGGLSKKQLEGLYSKATTVSEISPGKLATLQAIINRKPNRYKSEATINLVKEKDTVTEKIIEDILIRYPEHKRVVFLQSKFKKDGDISAAEKTELERFHKILLK